MRSLLKLAVITAWGLAAAGASAQGYPNKAVRVIVPYAAGGNMEHWRPTLAKVGQLLGQTFYMENKSGAGGNIGADAAAKAPADGYTLVIGTIGTHAINVTAYTKMPYDAIKDFTPIVSLATMSNAVIVNATSPVKSVPELIELSRANPGKLNFGSPGNGSSAHMTGELFAQANGLKLQHVPYKGSAPAMMDLMAGRIDIMFDNVPLPLPHIKAGKLRALAATAAQRAPVLPDLPTLAELGYKGFDVSSWYGIYAPAGLPRELVAKLNAAFNEAMKSPDVRDQLTAQGWQITGGTPEQFAAFTQAELDRWAKVVKAANVRIE